MVRELGKGHFIKGWGKSNSVNGPKPLIAEGAEKGHAENAEKTDPGVRGRKLV